MSETNQLKTMMLVVQEFQGIPTFSLIRVDERAPYVECMFIPQTKQFALVSNVKKDTFQMLPKLDDNGDMVGCKARKNGKFFKEERRPLVSYYEHMLVNREDIIGLIKVLAINEKTFKYLPFLDYVVPVNEEPVSEK